VENALQAKDLEMWLWTTHPAPSPRGPTASQIVEQTLDDLTPGSVIVLDVTTPQRLDQTVAALPEIIREARKRGYEFVPLSYVSPAVPQPPS